MKPANFLFLFYYTFRKFSQLKPQLKVETEDWREAP